MGREKNVLIELYLKKISLLIESEISISKMRIMHPNMNVGNNRKKPCLELDWNIPESYLIELASSFHAAKIASKNGKEVAYIDIQRHLEAFFNRVEIKRPHNKKSRLTNRVSITPFLDELKESFINDYHGKLSSK